MAASGNDRHVPIRSWAEEEQPRGKLLDKGPSALSNAELIAILIQVGTKDESALDVSRRLLNAHDSRLERLGKSSVEGFERFRGIGSAKAVILAAAMELGRRRREEGGEEKRRIDSSADVRDLMQGKLADLPHEEFWILLLNRANRLISRQLIGRGGVSGTVADTRLIFKFAIEGLASSLILCHNHPSGNLDPSKADISLTRKLYKAGELMDIPILDHVIVGEQDHYSFADEGMIGT